MRAEKSYEESMVRGANRSGRSEPDQPRGLRPPGWVMSGIGAGTNRVVGRCGDRRVAPAFSVRTGESGSPERIRGRFFGARCGTALELSASRREHRSGRFCDAAQT